MKEHLTGLKFTDHEDIIARQMAGWKIRNNSFSTMESILWRNTGTSAYQLQKTMLKSDKIWRTVHQSVVAVCAVPAWLRTF